MVLISYMSIPFINKDGTIDYMRINMTNNTIEIKGIDNKFHPIEHLEYYMSDGEESDDEGHKDEYYECPPNCACGYS